MSLPRRNGLLSSCEPCRKSKLKCDHTTPCARCRRRRKPAQCIYHPAPMTGKETIGNVLGLSSTDINSPVLLAGAKRVGESSPTLSYLSKSIPQENGDSPNRASEKRLRDRFIADWTKKSVSSPGTGVLGPTSYSAVYDEEEDVIRTPAVATSFRDFSKSLQPNQTLADDAEVQVGAELLLFLYEDLGLYERMSVSNFSHCEGYIFEQPLLRLLFASVRQMLNDAVTDKLNPLADLIQLSKKIFENCSRSIHVDTHMTPQDYFISMPNRWEVISAIFSILGASALLLPHTELTILNLNAAKLDRQGLSLLCISAGDKCLRFCENAGVMSEPLTWALLSHSWLLTLKYGDNDFRPWKVLGDLSTLIYALGFHQKENKGSLPLFLVEHRKRLLVGSYMVDKELATFLGRPPRISWRHINVDPPLDITYGELFAEPEIRDAAIRRLDRNGWNTRKVPTHLTFVRAMYQMGPVRELVVELSLNSSVENVESKIAEIEELAASIRNELPPAFRDPASSNTMTWSSQSKVWLHGFQLECLYNDLIMQRILVKRVGREPYLLRNIAHEMLNILLPLNCNRSIDGRDNNTVEWFSSFFGLPSAGILAIELLRQSHTSNPDPSFPRSEIIQNLSRFAGDLEFAIQREAGNYEICQQARKVIRSILDRVLSVPPVLSIPTNPTFMPIDWLASDDVWLNQDSDFMKWINNYAWSQEAPDI